MSAVKSSKNFGGKSSVNEGFWEMARKPARTTDPGPARDRAVDATAHRVGIGAPGERATDRNQRYAPRGVPAAAFPL